MLPTLNALPRADVPQVPASPTLVVLRPGESDQQPARAFIRHVYADRFGARVGEFAPTRVCLQDEGRIIAAAGYRLATEPLFLERYLDQPVDRLLGGPAADRRAIDRSAIAEVGHLSSTRSGASRRLIVALAVHLQAEGIDWVASTVTAELRRLFMRLGLGSQVLAAARAEALGAAAADWGDYYRHEPLVMAGHLPTAVAALARRWGRS